MSTIPALTRSEQSSNAIEVRSSRVHGLGVFSRINLRRGQIIGIYEGRRLDTDPEVRTDGLTYLFCLSDGGFIDGGDGGNATRHINHSCEPNCQAEEFLEMGGLGVRITALRAIKEDEELFLDYDLVVDPTDDASKYPCHCAVPTCRGSLVGVAAVE